MCFLERQKPQKYFFRTQPDYCFLIGDALLEISSDCFYLGVINLIIIEENILDKGNTAVFSTLIKRRQLIPHTLEKYIYIF